MQIKRLIKKIGAISTGAAFLGASLVGAMAADLSTYPDPFVVSGAANNAVIVHSANGLDSAAAGYILTGLSGAVTTTTAGSTVASVEGGYKLEYSGNKFNLNDTAYDINTKLSKTQLPILLKKGTFSDDEGTNTGDVEYVQEILFSNRANSDAEKTLWYIYDQNTEDSSEKAMGDYLYLSKSSDVWAWTYNFDLDSAVTVANSADLESTRLDLLGRTFTISSVGFTTGNVTKLTLLAGEVTQTVASGDTINGVKLVAVHTSGTSCNIEYQGAVYIINKGSTKTMPDGTIIGVTKVTPSNKQATPDYCELNIGADKVELENGKEIKVNGGKVTGSKVTFSSTQGLNQFNVSFKPEQKTFLKSGEEYKDPVFGAFKLIFGGIVETTPEDVVLSASGEKVDLTATNKDGDTTTWTVAFANTTGVGDIMPGADKDEPFIAMEGDMVTNTSMGESELSGMTGIRFLYSKGERSHVVRIKNINTLDNKTSFHDETTKTDYTDYDFTPEAATTFSFLPSTFQINFSKNSYTLSSFDIITFVDINDGGTQAPGNYVLKNGGNLTFWSNWSAGSGIIGYDGAGKLTGSRLGQDVVAGQMNMPYYITFGEVDTSKETNMPLNVVGINFTYSTTNQEINFQAIATSKNLAHRQTSLTQKLKSDTTLKSAKTVYGTYVEQITPTGSGTDTITLKTPDSATYANVWIAPIGASVSTSTGSTTGIDLMSADEVTDVSKYNAIVVGGPAANKVAAQLLGLTYPAYAEASGLNVGEAVIKMVTNGEKVALLAFGWEKDDTARAAKVLQDYDAFKSKLIGNEVSVEGTTANPDIVTSA